MNETVEEAWKQACGRLYGLRYWATLSALMEDGPVAGVDYEKLGREEQSSEQS